MITMKTKLILSFGLIPLILATLFLTVATSIDANAQNNTEQVSQPLDKTADPQQIKNYLNGAIQALDSGNNTQAEQQMDLADEQMEILTGSASLEDEDEGEEEGIEEGPGEDADEQGDVDVNDKEDTP